MFFINFGYLSLLFFWQLINMITRLLILLITFNPQYGTKKMLFFLLCFFQNKFFLLLFLIFIKIFHNFDYKKLAL